MLNITLKICCGTKVKFWYIWEHFAFQRMWLFNRARIIIMIQWFWNKDWDRINTLEGWQVSLWICKENALDWCNTKKFTNKDGSVSTKGWESSHYQTFTRVSHSIYSFSIAYWMKTSWHATVISHSSNYQLFPVPW